MATVMIDNKPYDLDTLPEQTRQLLQMVLMCEQKIQNLQNELAILQTARAAYLQTLQTQLPK